MGQLIGLENRAGKPIQVGDHQIIPIEQFLRLQPPGMWGFFLWRKPSAVVVQSPDGSEKLLRIQDPTRMAQIVLLGIALFGSLLIWMLSRLNVER